MAKPKAPAYAKRIEALKKKVAELKARGSRRRLLPPISEADIAAFEARAGVTLPDEMRAFYREVAGGEQRTDVPAILTLDQALTAAPVKPAEPFPFGDAEAQDLMARNQKKKRGEPSAALPGPMHGALPVMDLSSAIDCVVLQGEQRGKVWQSWDAGWTPNFAVKKGSPVPLDFLAWVEDIVADALAAAPPPITPETKVVNLVALGLTELPPALQEARQVETLALPSNQLKEVPSWLGDFQKLKDLRLNNNPIASLPDSLASLRALETLDLSSTKLAELPAWIGELRSLRRLVFQMDVFERLPDAIGDLAALEALLAKQNRLAGLPDTIGNLAKLTELDVSKNALTQLPSSIGKLSSLKTLRIAHNPLRALPAELVALPIESLELEGMPALDWEQAFDVLAKMPKLTTLVVNQALPTLPKALAGMQHLKTLRLIAVGLTDVPAAVTGLASLQELSLDQNKLTTLPDAVAQMPALKTVVLYDNPISKDEVARLRQQWPQLQIKHF